MLRSAGPGQRGANGKDGAVPAFTVTATTLPAGSQATAVVSGTPANPTLTIGVPVGAQGASAPTNGRLQLIGNVTISETMLVSLGLGIQRRTAALAGVTVTDKLFFAPNGVPTAGCEAVNVYASAANQVTVSMFLPTLGIGASYSVPISVYRITT